MPEWIITSQERGQKLLSFLHQRLENKYSLRFLKRALERHRCKVNGKVEHFASTPLDKGDHVLLEIEGFKPTTSFQFESFRLLYEDESLLIYNKPAGINSDEKGIVSLLQTHFPELYLAHRLDRDTTGVLLLAKSQIALEALTDQFRDRKIKKCYAAIVDGIPFKPKGVLDNFLEKKSSYQGQTIWTVASSSKKGGVHAYTEWHVVKKGKESALLYCFPKTGRMHQLRVHLSHLGHPILGDFQYGREFRCSYQPERLLLHAYRLSFDHPTTQARLNVEAPFPEDFREAERLLFKRKT